MSENNVSSLRSVAWSEVCPWLNIFRTFRLAASGRVLVLGAAGVLLTMSVWAVVGAMYGVNAPKPESIDPTDQQTLATLAWQAKTAPWMAPHDGCPWLAIGDAVPDQVGLATFQPAAAAPLTAATPWQASDPLTGVWLQLTRPLWAGLDRSTTFGQIGCLLICGLCSLAIWAFFGAAIARIAAVQLACDERVGLAAALRFACAKWLAYFAAPLTPLAGIIATAVPVALFGLLAYSAFGAIISGLFWPLMLVCGLVMALLLIGLVFGWPLMWGAISTEGTDSFDALSRSFAYTFQRPIHYFLYALIAAVFGGLSWLLVRLVAAAVIGMAYWAAAWGCGVDRVDELVDPSGLTGMSYAGAWLIHLWVGVVKVIAVGFIYGYFFTATTAIYFLLRRDVDATEMDEVYLDADAGELAPPLPPIKTDSEGAPVAEGPVVLPATPPAAPSGSGENKPAT